MPPLKTTTGGCPSSSRWRSRKRPHRTRTAAPPTGLSWRPANHAGALPSRRVWTLWMAGDGASSVGFRRVLVLARHEHSPPRLRRARARAGVEDGGEPADRPAVLRAGQCRHRQGGRMRRARHRRPRGGDRVLQGATRSTSWWSGRRRRWCAGIVDDLEAAGIKAFGPSKRRRGSKARRASPRTCAAPTTFRPRPTSASRRLSRRRPMCASRARRSSSRPTGSRPARAWSWRRRVAEAEAAIDMMFGGGLGAGRRRGGGRGIPGRRGGVVLRAVRRRDRDPARLGAGPQARRRRRHRARTPAAWAPIRRRR